MAVALLAFSAAGALAANDPLSPQQWGWQKIQAEAAWGIATGSGVTVAVVDTGVRFGHPDLAGKSAGAVNCTGETCGGGDVEDYNGHGTEVAGIIGATANNAVGVAPVAPSVGLMSVRVLGSDGTGSGEDVVRGIKYAADHGARVINLSLGPDRINIVLDLLCFNCNSDAFAAAFRYAAERGALVVAAAGNDQLNSFYAGMANVIVVGATGPGDERAGYSSSGADIFAPGGNSGNPCSAHRCILTTCYSGDGCTPDLSYRAVQGTSFAAPHVSGVGALLMSQGYSYSAAIDRMKATSDGGRVNACKAVGGCGGPPPAPPSEKARVVPVAPAPNPPGQVPAGGTSPPAQTGSGAQQAPSGSGAQQGSGSAKSPAGSTASAVAAPGQAPVPPDAPAAAGNVPTIQLAAPAGARAEAAGGDEGDSTAAARLTRTLAIVSLAGMALVLIAAFAIPSFRSRRNRR
ncbi:MAG: S8 family serine peptidase [Actinomycetota bacterium]